MLNNLKSFVASFFMPKHERLENQSLLEGVLSEDKMNEANAYALLLSDLARSDGNFDQNEKSIIEKTLAEIFPGIGADASILIQSACNTLDTFRDSSSFISRIKEEYSEEERAKLYALIDKVILADGLEDSIEKYLREKFKSALA